MRELATGRDVRGRIVAVAAWGGAALVVVSFGLLVADLARRGAGELTWRYLIEAPRDAGRAGGILPIAVATVWMVALALAFAAPLALATALFLDEAGTPSAPRALRRAAAVTRRSLDVLGGVPSIVFGLFGNALFCRSFGWGYSLLSGAATLACMVLPLMVATFDEGLQRVPAAERAAAAATGLSRSATLRHVLLPRAAPLLLAGTGLAVARSLAETAALLFTAGYADGWPRSPLDSARSLSVHVWDLALNVAGGDARACAAALLLLLVVLALHGAVRGGLGWVLRRRSRGHGESVR